VRKIGACCFGDIEKLPDGILLRRITLKIAHDNCGSLTGDTFPSPVMAPCALANIDGVTKSVKPPRTKNGAFGFLRGYDETNSARDTASAILVSLPTFPHLVSAILAKKKKLGTIERDVR
jgi:hypothetical protein